MSGCPHHARDAGDARLDAARGLLRRGSEVERADPAGSPLRGILAWVREFLARAHPDLGRSGPVCPFTPAALALDTIWLAEIGGGEADAARIADLVGLYRDLFLELEPREGSGAINKAMLLVFPSLGADGARAIDAVQAELKPRFVDVGLMLGEFHADNDSPGLRNPDFRPLRSPIPMLAIRHMVESDLPFLRRDIDPPQARAAFVRSYLRRLGNTMSRNSFEQAIEALVEAELQLRGIPRTDKVVAHPARGRAAKPGRVAAKSGVLDNAGD